MKRGKRYQAAVKERPTETVSLRDAVRFVKERAAVKFDETIEVHIRLGVDPKKSDQTVRGTAVLPHGAPSPVRVAVFTDDPRLQVSAKTAGADLVGGTELINTVAAEGALAADVAVTTPDMMSALARVAKILGPRGLMPNPKSGTIGADPAHLVKSLKGGKISFKMDNSGNVHVAVAKVSWELGKIEENARSLIEAVRQTRPATTKGEFLRTVSLSSTMGPSVRVRA